MEDDRTMVKNISKSETDVNICTKAFPCQT